MTGELHRLAGAYALGALDAEEAAFFERHLAVCEACRGEVAGYLETAAALGMASAEAPPPSLRDAVLDEVGRTRQVRPTAEVPLRTRMRRNLAAIAAVLVVVVVALGATSVYLIDRLDQQRGTSSVAGQVERILVAEDAQTTRLEPSEGAEAQASLVYAPSQDAAVLIARDLPAVPAGEVVQLWLFHDGVPHPAAVAQVGADGAVQVVQEGLVSGAEMAAVTIEPDGGSPAPTGPVLLSAALDG